MQPQVAVIQAGYRNRFGHPVAEVLDRLADRGVQVQQNVACGAWRWPAGRPLADATCERVLAARYWHWRAQP